jgi:hypothetical protein
MHITMSSLRIIIENPDLNHENNPLETSASLSRVTAEQREYRKNLIHLEFNQSPGLYFKWPSLSSCTAWLVPCRWSSSSLRRFCLSFWCVFKGFVQMANNYATFISNSFTSIWSKQLQYRRSCMLTGHSIQHFIHIFRYRKIYTQAGHVRFDS